LDCLPSSPRRVSRNAINYRARNVACQALSTAPFVTLAPGVRRPIGSLPSGDPDHGTCQVRASVMLIQYPTPGAMTFKVLYFAGRVVSYVFQGAVVSKAS
jgi:hypothetical protein